MNSQYDKLLTTERFRTSTVAGRNVVGESESDRGRLLFCAAFRRLQQKAQVFSLEPNAAVRSRLTHSFEVSQMGRYIADKIVAKLVETELATTEQCIALVTFVETACLMHDIGNPPFGHFGEAAICKWFRDKGPSIVAAACTSVMGPGDVRAKTALADFEEFDGNPQGLRVVTKLQRNSDEHGLNLTKTTIGAYLKYVRSSDAKPDKSLPFTKKCGYFATETALVKSVWQHFGYTTPQRFPLAYIMEAADDIAYCISDLEDSIEKGLVVKETAFSNMVHEWNALPAFEVHEQELCARIAEILKKAANGKSGAGEPFTYTDFRTSLNRELVDYSAQRYVKEHDNILAGTLVSLMPTESPAGSILDLLKKYCRENVYCHEVVQRVELAGYTAIYGLLDKFSCLLDCDVSRFTLALDHSNTKDETGAPIVIEKKLLSLFSKNYIKTYQDDLKTLDVKDADYLFHEWRLRAHLVTDYLSGMTDDFAMTTFRTLSGMRL
jgi:dGTPase